MNSKKDKVFERQIIKYCADNITRLDGQIYMGQMTKAQVAEAYEVIAQLRHVMRTPSLIAEIASHCTIQPRLIQYKFHNGTSKRKIHRYVYGIPQAMKTCGIF